MWASKNIISFPYWQMFIFVYKYAVSLYTFSRAHALLKTKHKVRLYKNLHLRCTWYRQCLYSDINYNLTWISAFLNKEIGSFSGTVYIYVAYLEKTSLIYLSMYLSVCLSALCLPICLCVCLSINGSTILCWALAAFHFLVSIQCR